MVFTCLIYFKHTWSDHACIGSYRSDLPDCFTHVQRFIYHQEFITQVTALANKGTCVCDHEEPELEETKKETETTKKREHASKLSAAATA